MAATDPPGRERRSEQAIALLLRAGVLLAAAVVLGGGIYYLIRHGAQLEPWSIFRGEPADLRQLPGIFHAARAGLARGIIQVGLLLLILTPIARVAFSAVVFWRDRDRTYVAITLAVLAVLLYNLLLGWR